MSSNAQEVTENICIVCFKNVDIYSIGNCDHMVCYECSTRMRVLCRQNECPICRQELPKVVFTRSIKPFSEISNLAPYEDNKFKILFNDKKIQDAFYKLLEHCCSVCQNKPLFRTFQQLYDHMRKEHELHYCDLCVEHLKIFTSERRCYTKSELTEHRRKGDPDDRSHRGHPLCKFCLVRYMDNDFLYRHLRKDHLFCHFCDADGHDLYYSSYDYLRDHFREEHYLCEEGACIEEKFTVVFRTEIDLKAHRMSAHGRTMGKAAAKQARTLELEFTLKPRPRQHQNHNQPEQSFALENAVSKREERPVRMHSPSLDPSEFPSLPSGSGTVTVSAPQRRGGRGLTIQAVGRRNAPLAITDENFPVLGDYNENTQGTSVRLNINQDRNSNSKRTGPSVTPRNVSIRVNHRSYGEQNISIRQDDFPALSSEANSGSMPSAKWVSVTNKKPCNSKKPPQQAKPLQEGDFPGLNSKFSANLNLNSNERNGKGGETGNRKKAASSVVMAVGSNWGDSLEASGSSLKGKVKKKKSKVNNNGTGEEKSDTAKKKEGDGNQLVKPLPTVEDWFGDGRKKTETEANSNYLPLGLDHRNGFAGDRGKPPPGFEQQNGFSGDGSGKPPPGFNFLPANGLTFTNSSGESFAIPTGYNYSPPADFEKRNQNLVGKVIRMLLNDGSLEQFKKMSAFFRHDMLSAEEYCNHCVKTMGEDGFREIIPELLILLPDINKQQELYQVLARNSKFEREKRKLQICETCRQVLCNSDMKEHTAQHTLNENFPLLMPNSNCTK